MKKTIPFALMLVLVCLALMTLWTNAQTTCTGTQQTEKIVATAPSTELTAAATIANTKATFEKETAATAPSTRAEATIAKSATYKAEVRPVIIMPAMVSDNFAKRVTKATTVSHTIIPAMVSDSAVQVGVV
jgi:hypothetical protein